MNMVKMRMLKQMCGNTRKERIRNETICKKVKIGSIKDKLREG